jgi:hypothetical protein
MNKAVRVILPIWTIVMFLFFFVPMGGSTGFEGVLIDGGFFPWAGVAAGVGAEVGLIVMLVRQWLKR